MESDDAGSGAFQVKEIVSGTSYTRVADANSHVTVAGQTLAAGAARLYRIVRDRPGTVSLSTTTPTVGALVTATLEDPDVPVTNELWTWQRRLPDSETVEVARAPLQSLDDLFQPTFTPSVLDVGRELRASVSYRDVHSSSDGFGLSLLDKSAHSVWTEPVEFGSTGPYLQVVTETESGGLQFVVSTCPLPLREPGPECPAPTGGGCCLRSTMWSWSAVQDRVRTRRAWSSPGSTSWNSLRRGFPPASQMRDRRKHGAGCRAA